MPKYEVKYSLGETIMITPTKEAFVTAICIRNGLVRYELCYLDDCTPKDDWFDEELIERILFNAKVEDG